MVLNDPTVEIQKGIETSLLHLVHFNNENDPTVEIQKGIETSSAIIPKGRTFLWPDRRNTKGDWNATAHATRTILKSYDPTVEIQKGIETHCHP